ncbi:DUF4174 domain-containing protein [Christiangramia echinicola]|uniref:DUF4174 domain-containing protein n=1 Tax=Christiangramia echinicola TaxID=279359 RepID=A0A1H1NEV2_9FLAO|nr:DUF4174 domain-containing protein [Christiangramia echinicola]SDR97355.1 protein of unknown function [Christiangramia echinicola]
MLSIFLTIPLTMHSQSLFEYQWKNRLIVIFTETSNSREFQKQMQILNQNQNQAGLNDRKIKVIHVIPDKHQIVFPEKSGWQNSNLYQKKESKIDFEVILIGLDGGVKLRETNPVEIEKLFDLIDSMPMRKAEMRRNDN